MSTILKALRKVEEDRRPPEERPLREQVVAVEPGKPLVRGRRRWPQHVLLGLLGAGLVGVFLWLGIQAPFGEPPRPRNADVAAPPPAAPEPATPADRDSARAPAVRAAPPPAPAPRPVLAARPSTPPAVPSGRILGEGLELADLPPDIPTVSARPPRKPATAPRPEATPASRRPEPPLEEERRAPALAGGVRPSDSAPAPAVEPAAAAPPTAEAGAARRPDGVAGAVGARGAAEPDADSLHPHVGAPPPLPVVLRTRWHPRPGERAAWLAPGPGSREAAVSVGEGDRFLGLTVEEIEPSAVVFARGSGERIRRRVGER